MSRVRYQLTVVVSLALAGALAPIGTSRAAESSEKSAPLTFGASDGGGLAAKLRLRRAETAKTWTHKASTGTAYWGGTADGVWSSTQDARNQIDIGSEIGYVSNFSTMTSKSEHILTAALSFRGRRGQFEDENGQVVRHDDYLYGPKLIYRVSWQRLNDFLSKYAGDLGERPSLTAGYYRISGKTADLAVLPDRLRADEWYAQLRFDVPAIPIVSGPTTRSVMLGVLAQASKPLEGQDRSWAKFIDATLSMSTDGAWRPAISYRSGEKDGFTYDRQIILGLTWDLFAKSQ